MVRVPPSGTWERRRADLYAAAEDWLGPPSIKPDAAIEHVVHSYLRGFGPATKGDIASWSGLPVGAITPVLARIETRGFRAEDGAELVDLPRQPLPDPETSAPPRFLPTWDANLLVHARRTQILPEQYRSLVFSTKNPHSTPTFLVDGTVAGAWRYEDGHVRLAPYCDLGTADRAALEEEGERLAAFHADQRRSRPTP
jgi:Winged helix DNA-binding domain